MTKILPIILLALSILTCSGQNNINQMNEYGQKTGLWVKYHDNGKIDESFYYEPTERKLSIEEKFFHNIGPDKDSIVYSGKLKWAEIYEYNENWDLRRIVRTENSQQPIFFYGPNREISIKKHNEFFIERVSSTVAVIINLHNNSDKPINLWPELRHSNITANAQLFTIPDKQSEKLKFELFIEPMDNNHTITLMNDSILIDYDIMTRGYHISSIDFDKGEQITIQNNFVYYRTGNEALLKIYNHDNTIELKTISLSKTWTAVDINEFGQGYYSFATISYSDNELKYCKVKIE